MKSPKPLHKLLHGSSDALSRVLGHAGRLAALDRILRPQLGQPLASHCRVANLRRDTLVLQVDSPAWAARLRYQIPALLKTLRGQERGGAGLEALRDIEVRVSPPTRERPAPTQRAVRMSSDSARLIEAVAQDTDDAALQSALRRLAGRHRGPED